MDQSSRLGAAGFFWLLAGVGTAVFALLMAMGVEWISTPPAQMQEAGWVAAAIGVVVLTVDVYVPVPSNIVMILNGTLFGAVWGTMLSVAGGFMATLVGWLTGRYFMQLFPGLVRDDPDSTVNLLLQRHGPFLIIASRPIPILSESVAILAGSQGMALGTLVYSGALGAVPHAVIYALLGQSLISGSAPLMMGALIVVVSSLYWLFGRSLLRYGR